MTITIVSSRTFSRGLRQAKLAALSGPVVVTDRGRPTHVLLSIAEYRRLSGPRRNIADAVGMPGVADIGFEPERAEFGFRAADLD